MILDVIEAIAEYAFQSSPYPVVLRCVLHCTVRSVISCYVMWCDVWCNIMLCDVM